VSDLPHFKLSKCTGRDATGGSVVRGYITSKGTLASSESSLTIEIIARRCYRLRRKRCARRYLSIYIGTTAY
jgi:hypothetical protein